MTREDKLIRQLKKGRQECLDELIALTYPAVLRYCLWHMPDRESAQDAAQETFLRLVRFLGQYEQRGHFHAWLYRIASNVCADLRRRTPPALSYSEETVGQFACTEAGLQTAENRLLLARAYACLDSQTRELVLLRYGQELTYREIADITGIPARTVQTRLRRALVKMRRILSDEIPPKKGDSHRESTTE